MEHKKSRWHKKRVGGTKKESVEQNQSQPGIFKESVPYHPARVPRDFFNWYSCSFVLILYAFLCSCCVVPGLYF